MPKQVKTRRNKSPSPFNIFTSENHVKVKQINKGATSAEVNYLLGVLWKRLPDSKRREYEERSQKLQTPTRKRGRKPKLDICEKKIAAKPLPHLLPNPFINNGTDTLRLDLLARKQAESQKVVAEKERSTDLKLLTTLISVLVYSLQLCDTCRQNNARFSEIIGKIKEKGLLLPNGKVPRLSKCRSFPIMKKRSKKRNYRRTQKSEDVAKQTQVTEDPLNELEKPHEAENKPGPKSKKKQDAKDTPITEPISFQTSPSRPCTNNSQPSVFTKKLQHEDRPYESKPKTLQAAENKDNRNSTALSSPTTKPSLSNMVGGLREKELSKQVINPETHPIGACFETFNNALEFVQNSETPNKSGLISSNFLGNIETHDTTDDIMTILENTEPSETIKRNLEQELRTFEQQILAEEIHSTSSDFNHKSDNQEVHLVIDNGPKSSTPIKQSHREDGCSDDIETILRGIESSEHIKRQLQRDLEDFEREWAMSKASAKKANQGQRQIQTNEIANIIAEAHAAAEITYDSDVLGYDSELHDQNDVTESEAEVDKCVPAEIPSFSLVREGDAGTKKSANDSNLEKGQLQQQSGNISHVYSGHMLDLFKDALDFSGLDDGLWHVTDTRAVKNDAFTEIKSSTQPQGFPAEDRDRDQHRKPTLASTLNINQNENRQICQPGHEKLSISQNDEQPKRQQNETHVLSIQYEGVDDRQLSNDSCDSLNSCCLTHLNLTDGSRVDSSSSDSTSDGNVSRLPQRKRDSSNYCASAESNDDDDTGTDDVINEMKELLDDSYIRSTTVCETVDTSNLEEWFGQIFSECY